MVANCDHKELKDKISQLEKNMNVKFKDIYTALNFLLDKDKKEIEQKGRKRIGYK